MQTRLLRNRKIIQVRESAQLCHIFVSGNLVRMKASQSAAGVLDNQQKRRRVMKAWLQKDGSIALFARKFVLLRLLYCASEPNQVTVPAAVAQTESLSVNDLEQVVTKKDFFSFVCAMFELKRCVQQHAIVKGTPIAGIIDFLRTTSEELSDNAVHAFNNISISAMDEQRSQQHKIDRQRRFAQLAGSVLKGHDQFFWQYIDADPTIGTAQLPNPGWNELHTLKRCREHVMCNITGVGEWDFGAFL